MYERRLNTLLIRMDTVFIQDTDAIRYSLITIITLNDISPILISLVLQTERYSRLFLL